MTFEQEVALDQLMVLLINLGLISEFEYLGFEIVDK
jgi:hypothetical protein